MFYAFTRSRYQVSVHTTIGPLVITYKCVSCDKTRQDKIYFESARHITINISSRALLNQLFENKCIKSAYVQQQNKQNSL